MLKLHIKDHLKKFTLFKAHNILVTCSKSTLSNLKTAYRLRVRGNSNSQQIKCKKYIKINK